METTNPHQNVTFSSNGGQAHGYLATPPTGSGPGLVVVQEWWGLTDQMAGVVDRYAAEGYVTLAPDLYGGKTTHDGGEAGAMMQALPVEQAVRDLSGAVDYLLGLESTTGTKVGVVGYCMGGGFVLQLANVAGDKVAAAVTFYGVVQGDSPDFSGISAPVLGHFGERDEFVPPPAAAALEDQVRAQADVPVTFHHYPAGHAFCNEQNLLGTYDQRQAGLAWSRTLEFLGARLP